VIPVDLPQTSMTSFKVAKVVHGNWSDKYCNWLDTLLHVHTTTRALLGNIQLPFLSRTHTHRKKGEYSAYSSISPSSDGAFLPLFSLSLSLLFFRFLESFFLCFFFFFFFFSSSEDSDSDSELEDEEEEEEEDSAATAAFFFFPGEQRHFSTNA